MTDMLQDVLHAKADSLETPHFDVGAMVREGDRRRRRRTAGTGVAAAAAIAVGLLAAQPLLPGGAGDGGDSHVADGSDTAPHPLTWAEGQVLHVEDRTVDTGLTIRSYVQVDSGIVMATPELEVHAVVGDRTQPLGSLAPVRSDVTELVADGDRAAWVDPGDELVSVDVGTGRESRLPVVPGDDARVTAVDGSTVWLVDGRGVAAWDTDTGEVEVRGPADDGLVIDAEAGSLLLDGKGTRKDRVETPGGTVALQVDDFANLSPDGELVSTSFEDTGYLLDARTGAQLPFDHGREWAIAYQWLDDTEVAVLVFDVVEGEASSMRPALLRCDTAADSCTVAAAQLPAEFGSFQLPVGVHFEE